ncbi:MAG TPA: tRNA (adenosine(37)-N6)-threonylcarbamoyltransferase complex dimerization subunit type 1 TsaB [Anaerolineaceae bacterium]|nr:tRNA (adenosine(37)-N6)-threonylcarbamoyltransferase complex dimerization subunit type 1 TsaB [Anaerolineaceae bacterium]
MLLAIDTSTEWIGIALFNGTNVLAEQIWRSKNYHTVELVPAIKEMLTKTQTKASSLTGIGVALGPGSFTGLRIGLSVAKGIALGQKLPVAGIPTLEILAAAQPGLRRPMLAFLEVGRGRYAYARYQYKQGSWQAITDIAVNDIRDMASTIKSPIYVVGDMDAEQRQILGRKWKTARLASPSLCLRRPAVLAELAWAKIQAGQADDAASLAPIYVHTLSNVPDL